MKRILLAAVLGLWSASAMAHSPLSETVPQKNAVVSQMPLNVFLGFKGGIRLTRVTMTHAGQNSVDLDFDKSGGFVSEYSIPLQPMGNGPYTIEWRGLGVDGHAMNGSFGFTVQ